MFTAINIIKIKYYYIEIDRQHQTRMNDAMLCGNRQVVQFQSTETEISVIWFKINQLTENEIETEMKSKIETK